MMSEIVSTEGVLGGAPRIEGRRIGVHHIAQRVIDGGEDPGQVAADYEIEINDVHRALSYYYDHSEEMQEVQARGSSIPDGVRVIRGPEDLDGSEQPEPGA